MSVTYHKPTALCTANVPPWNHAVVKRTPASDGFQILPCHRNPNGNVSWSKIQKDLVLFLGGEIRGLWWTKSYAEQLVRESPYDDDLLKVFRAPNTPNIGFHRAKAFGFDPVFIWPNAASKWPSHFHHLPRADEALAPDAVPDEESESGVVSESQALDIQPADLGATVAEAIASAESFTVAVDCLPVGKDIRNRLQAHVRKHIELLRRIGGDPA